MSEDQVLKPADLQIINEMLKHGSTVEVRKRDDGKLLIFEMKRKLRNTEK